MADKNSFELITKDPVTFNMLSLKSKLFMILVDLIRKEGWTQKAAAENLKVTQPRISNLLKGQLDKFSTETLLEMILSLGYKMDLSYKPGNQEQPLEMVLKKAML
ncbi:Cro/CI family transcriptional regulator [Pseudomonas luteola]|uniref:Cro/CI family transcriptional regulator n=1 Tax=Pseudomonas luteola TaxID=47886 RepID=A0A2X2E0X5_PSELU|nr:XRE family transcriptional regulator [Pseudomonas luteola]SPZ01719.1 Cro/CI family transcriptional regulator [Pseudomonas luteola]